MTLLFGKRKDIKMKLIGTENLERQFTISISESDLGTLFLALGK